MRRVVVSEFVTLDGVMEDPGGSEDFERGGWAFQFERGPEGDQFKLDETMQAGALLLGRVTYEGFAEAWPSREGPFAEKMNSMEKLVVSSTLDEPTWQNTRVLRGDAAEEVRRLKEGDGGDLLVAGSARLVQVLLDAGLVDELRLMVFPLVLGRGKRLFAEGAERWPLRFVEARPAGEVLIVILEPVSA